MKLKPWLTALLAPLLLTLMGTAWANDSVGFTNVQSLTAPYGAPVIANNPSNLVTYTINAANFPCSDTVPIATFSFQWTASVPTTGQHPSSYPVTVNLADSNGAQFTLTPNTNSFQYSSDGQSGTVTVSVYIPTAGCGSLGTANGTTLQAKLAESTSAGHVNANDFINVHIVLAVPQSQTCLHLYTTESNQDTLDELSQVTVIAPHGNVKTTNPGTISVEGLVVNTCSTAQNFDIDVALSPDWDTQPSNNPGNATFLFTSTAGNVDLSNYGLVDWGSGTPQGEAVCLPSVTLASGSSLLVRVHSQIMSGTAVSVLPPDSFPFTVTLDQATSASTCGAGSPLTNVDTNPNTNSLGYTVK